jgi:hypothetical protein
MKLNLLLQSLLMLIWALPAPAADRTAPPKPIYTEVFIRAVGDGRSEEVSGDLISFDDQSLAGSAGRWMRKIRLAPPLAERRAWTAP